MKPLVFQSDFGSADGAVSAMYGVAETVNGNLHVYDLTHDIPQYNIWEASYRLIQTVAYWPAGSVFVSVVDPGVGTERRSLVAKTLKEHLVVTPDNGTLTHLKKMVGLSCVRLIDETVNRLPNSGQSYTFYGRDVYAYTGARLASGILAFEEVGPEIPVSSITDLPFVEAYLDADSVRGTIDVLDVRFGSLWTNINRDLFSSLEIAHGGRVEVCIENETRTVYQNFMLYVRSFADVRLGEPLIYVNSLNNMAVAINQGSFALAYNIGTGNSWRISFRKAPRLIYE